MLLAKKHLEITFIVIKNKSLFVVDLLSNFPNFVSLPIQMPHFDV